MKSYFSPKGFRILAHRGGSYETSVENTLEAFRFAYAAGLRYFETDVQATKDGVAVLFHDETLERLTGQRVRISELTFAEVKTVSLSSAFARIPSLQEALDEFPDARFNLDLKTEGSIAPASAVIRRSRDVERVLVSSFSARRRRAVVHLLPGVATSADAMLAAWLVILSQLRLRKVFAFFASNIDALQVPIKLYGLKFERKTFIEFAHLSDLEVHYWTINDIGTAQRLKSLGADGIVTDAGKLMFEWLTNSQAE